LYLFFLHMVHLPRQLAGPDRPLDPFLPHYIFLHPILIPFFLPTGFRCAFFFHLLEPEVTVFDTSSFLFFSISNPRFLLTFLDRFSFSLMFSNRPSFFFKHPSLLGILIFLSSYAFLPPSLLSFRILTLYCQLSLYSCSSCSTMFNQ